VKIAWLLLVLAVALKIEGAEPMPLHKLQPGALEERLRTDSAMVLLHRQGLSSVIEYLSTQKELFSSESTRESRLLHREEKELVWAAWQRFLDYTMALMAVEQSHSQFHRLSGHAREESFLIGYAAMLARYRASLEFIELMEKNPELHKVLNDAVPELGLPAGTYAKLKLEHLNMAIASEFAARELLMKTFSGNRLPDLRTAIKADSDHVWKTGQIRGQVLTTRNAIKIIQDGAQSGWLPIQQGVSEWMGHTKVYRANQALISDKQIEQLQPKLMPGDVLLERREWYLSNIGLPGFWSHAALYIGTREERQAFFNDPAVLNWVKEQGEPTGELELLLQKHSPIAYESAVPGPRTHGAPAAGFDSSGKPVRIIEAIGEGVSLKSLEHSAACDSLVVLRPRLAKVEKAQALVRAFHYVGRPYDFDFDFSTDAKLVCTELVYKSYEPSTGCVGLKFPMVEMLGRKVTPANELAKQFDAQFGTADQQYDMICFLDERERTKNAVESNLAEFRQSWRRPKWHVLVQE
jgi:hypothetical protein